MGRIYKYDDQWIREHYDPKIRWRSLLEDYNRTFGTDIKYPTFVSHMNRELKLQQDYCIPYTAEQDNWLKENYPHIGKTETTRIFNELFHENKKPKAIQQRCKVLGLYVTRERKAKSCVENHKRSQPIGTVKIGLYKVPAVKIADGEGRKNWQRLDEKLIGKKAGMVILHLDGNPANCELDNLMHVPRNILGTMGKEGFYSSDKDITKAGVIWCELFNALKVRKENLTYGDFEDQGNV